MSVLSLHIDLISELHEFRSPPVRKLAAIRYGHAHHLKFGKLCQLVKATRHKVARTMRKKTQSTRKMVITSEAPWTLHNMAIQGVTELEMWY